MFVSYRRGRLTVHLMMPKYQNLGNGLRRNEARDVVLVKHNFFGFSTGRVEGLPSASRVLNNCLKEYKMSDKKIKISADPVVRRMVEMEFSTRNKPKVWFVERFDMINGKVELRAICTTEQRAGKYQEYFRRIDRENETRARTYITERELDHLWGASMTQSI